MLNRHIKIFMERIKPAKALVKLCLFVITLGHVKFTPEEWMMINDLQQTANDQGIVEAYKKSMEVSHDHN